MKQLLLVAIKCKANPNSSGFSLLEALVGILVITTFTLIALQALAISAAFRVKATRESGATNWIQERVENAKFIASQLDVNDDGPNADPDTCQAIDTDKDNKNVDNGYAAQLKQDDEDDERLPSTNVGDSDLNLDYNSQLDQNELGDAYKLDPDGDDFTFYTLVDPNDNENMLQRNFTIKDNDYEPANNANGGDIWLLRRATPKYDPDNPNSEQPYQVLELEYIAVLEENGSNAPSTTTSNQIDEDDIVAELYTEIIPDEAFACN